MAVMHHRVAGWLDLVPMSAATSTDGLVFCAGAIGMDMTTGHVVGDDVADQTHQALANVDRMLAAAGAVRADLLRVTIYLTDQAHFATFNEIYAGWLGGQTPPARTALITQLALPTLLVEVDAVAGTPPAAPVGNPAT